MKFIAFVAVVASAFVFSCGPATDSNNMRLANSNSNANSTTPQTLTTVDTPERIKDQMATRGEQDSASPTLKIVEPKADSSIASSTVKVKLDISGDLKGYEPHMDPSTKTGNHIHVILDNQPYEAYYNLEQPFELRNVSDGEHTLRVFASRPWHESYKNDGSFQMVKFTVKNGGADTNKPATTNSGQPMSNVNTNSNANSNSNASAVPTPEGKEMQASTADTVDPKKPLLTYSRPKGEYKGLEADPIMIDFWLANGKLIGDGGEYRVRYSVDGGEAQFIEKWAPVWLSGWAAGKHSVKLELVDKAGNVVDNGGFNSTTREITVTK
jgi:hypothetical protein